MVRDLNDRPPKLKRGDSKSETPVKQLISADNSNIYSKILEFEEQEALRFSKDDLKLFKETCAKFKEIIKTVGDLKMKHDPASHNQITSCRIDGSILFAKMKKLNRLEKFRLNNAREKLYDTKRQVDNLHLQWQNLLYETHHLRREITKCVSFKSKDEHIELVPIEEFYAQAPKSISKPEITKKDQHQLKLARLEWELHQRKVLAEESRQLENKKDETNAEIRKKRDRLENLVPMIKNILTATKPVQEHLGLSFSEIRSDTELDQLLPPSLYFLSIQADAMREACDPLLKLSIIGDRDVAARVNNNISELTTIIDLDSDDESKNHHHRRKTRTQIREERIKKLLMKHPLSVNLQISSEDGSMISIIFHYLINLRIVTVVPSIGKNKFDGLSCRYLLEPRNLLNGLFEGDYGEQSPNVANSFQLQQAGIEFNAFELGVPYVWAQKLCGLDYSHVNENRKVNAEQRNLTITVGRIREHVKKLVELCEQLHDVEKLMVPTKYQDLTHIPVKVSCTLSKWELVSHDQLSCMPNTNNFITNFNLTEHDIYFRAIFIRNAAKLTAVIAVGPSYPSIPPLFCLIVENDGKKYSVDNCSDLRDMEKEMNIYVDELMEKLGKRRNWILTAQLNKLAVCFDIFLECTDSDNFPREKLFYFRVRGRTRSLPFKFIKQENDGIFVQR